MQCPKVFSAPASGDGHSGVVDSDGKSGQLPPMSTDTDIDALMLRIARGERAALGALFDSEAGRLIAIARRIVRQTERAEDVVQEVFVSLWRNAASFDRSRGPARAWLTTMTRNRALNALRDGARLDYVDDTVLADMGDRSTDASAALEALAERDALRGCLDALDEGKRKAILLCYVTGMNHGEVAATLNAPLGTVKAWIRRGVFALQECLS